jgi:cell wall-associated NlpC family hydrolase
MRRLAVLAALVLTLPVAASAAPGSWAQPQIRAAVASGLMSGGPVGFRPDDPLLPSDLAQIVVGLTGTAAETTAGSAARAPVTLGGLDATLVRTEGLGDAAYRFYLGARRAGLAPPARFGTETVARLIGLRTNHPAAQDKLELQPGEPATRAEAAFSAARALELDELTRQWVKDTAAVFEVGELTDWQRRILSTAVRFIGYPYVWGGEDEKTERGFDCSGFVWRVYKLQAYPGSGVLPEVLRGRMSYEMSGEVRPAARIGFDDLQPGDVLFFGPKGERSKPKEIDHMSLYLGNGWMIHSSRYGVAPAPLDGWYRDGFAWARRPLAEAGLESLT